MIEAGDDARTRLRNARADAHTRLEHLTRDFDAIVAAADGTPPDDEHDPDGSTVGFERAQVISLAASTQEQITAIDAALARIDAGTYGRCERCARPIEPARLEAVPTATACIRCATARRRPRAAG